jgi:hypothetical protein
MTAEELDAVADALSVFTVDETLPSGAKAATGRQAAAHSANMQFARYAAGRFNVELEPQRVLLERARAKHDAGERVPDDLRVELSAAAVLYRDERDRIERRFGLRVRRSTGFRRAA